MVYDVYTHGHKDGQTYRQGQHMQPTVWGHTKCVWNQTFGTTVKNVIVTVSTTSQSFIPVSLRSSVVVRQISFIGCAGTTVTHLHHHLETDKWCMVLASSKANKNRRPL